MTTDPTVVHSVDSDDSVDFGNVGDSVALLPSSIVSARILSTVGSSEDFASVRDWRLVASLFCVAALPLLALSKTPMSITSMQRKIFPDDMVFSLSLLNRYIKHEMTR